MIRDAKPKDINKLTELGVCATSQCKSMRVCKDKIRSIIEQGVNKPNHCLLSEEGGKVTGMLCGISVDNTFHEKKHLYVIEFGLEANDEWSEMLNILKAWFDKKPVLKNITIMFDYDYDIRIDLMLESLGFVKRGCAFIFER